MPKFRITLVRLDRYPTPDSWVEVEASDDVTAREVGKRLLVGVGGEVDVVEVN